MKPKAHCKDFRGMATNGDICVRWNYYIDAPQDLILTASIKAPYCNLGLTCPTSGQRLMARADQEEDGV